MLVREGAGSLMVWETVTRNYFFIFFSALEVWVFFLQSLISQTVLCVPSNSEMKQETNVITIITYLCSFEMVRHHPHISIDCLFLHRCFRVWISVVAMMASSGKCLYMEDEIEQSLLGELTASDQSSCSDDYDSVRPMI